MKPIYPGLQNFVKKGLFSQRKLEVLFKSAVDVYGYQNTLEVFKKYCYNIKRRHLGNSPKKQKIIKPSRQAPAQSSTSPIVMGEPSQIETKLMDFLLKGKKINVFKLCEILECYPNRLIDAVKSWNAQGKEIFIINNEIWLNKGTGAVISEPTIKPPKVATGKEIVFGVMSDLHFGSRACQITAMNLFAEKAKSEGVEHIFIPGDVTAGNNVYRGQSFELYEPSSEHQEESCIVNLPKGFTYYMLGGNHDYSFMKAIGHNVIRSLCLQRDDFIYCGFDWAEIDLMDDVTVGLWHPAGANPYSISYRLQKGVEAIAFTELKKIAYGQKDKPTLHFVLAGHLHIQMSAFFGNIFGAQCGAFEGSNSFTKARKLMPTIGGYIIRATMAKSGILDIVPKFCLFPEIENDWKNYNHKTKKDHLIPEPFKW